MNKSSRDFGRLRITFPVGVVLLLLAGLSFMGWLRVAQASTYAGWLENLPDIPGNWYFYSSGIAWGAIPLLPALSILLQRRWSGIFTIGALAVYILWRWFERLVFGRSALLQTNVVFAAILDAALLAFVFLVMRKSFAAPNGGKPGAASSEIKR